MPEAICRICQQSFFGRAKQVRNPNGPYCSTGCANKGREDPRPVVLCQQCSTPFEAFPSQIETGRAKFCSRACFGLSARAVEESTCLQCGASFHVKASHLAIGEGLYCCRACMKAYEATHGRFVTRHGKRMTTIERFWNMVEKTQRCWLWTGALDKDGYGLFTREDKVLVRAHRFAYELTHGPILAPLILVCHTCDTPPCIRPSHLFLGSHDDNLYDAARKGRIGIKLTEENIREIVKLSRMLPQQKIADRFGISQSYVSVLIRLSRR